MAPQMDYQTLLGIARKSFEEGDLARARLFSEYAFENAEDYNFREARGFLSLVKSAESNRAGEHALACLNWVLKEVAKRTYGLRESEYSKLSSLLANIQDRLLIDGLDGNFEGRISAADEFLSYLHNGRPKIKPEEVQAKEIRPEVSSVYELASAYLTFHEIEFNRRILSAAEEARRLLPSSLSHIPGITQFLEESFSAEVSRVSEAYRAIV
ncbi:MAG: hypothetical protein V1820_02865 [archaeon]